MKEVREWNENYILNIPAGEHDWVEFKEARKLDLSLSGVKDGDVRNELSKQISAFANTGGGTIVYGVSDAPPGATRMVDASGGVSLSIKDGTKEWLEDIIPQLVDFPLLRFNIYVVVGDAPTSGIGVGKGLILVEIPESESAPHQANDYKYYARVGGKSRPIPHRLVLDIIGRARHPKMNVTCEVVSEGRYDGSKKRYLPILRFRCRNQGRVFANYVNGFISIPATLASVMQEEDAFERTLNNTKYIQKYFDNTIHDRVGQVDRYMGSMGITTKEATYISRFNPVLPSRHCATSVKLLVPLDQLADHGEEEILWEVYADSAPVERGRIKVAELVRNLSE
jgi:hypothetical protein